MCSERVTTLSPRSADTGIDHEVGHPQPRRELRELRADLLEDLLRPVDEVHLVDAQHDVRHLQQRGEEGVPPALLDEPLRASTSTSARSAVEAPVTMFRVYWMCPGVSAMMKFLLAVEK